MHKVTCVGNLQGESGDSLVPGAPVPLLTVTNGWRCRVHAQGSDPALRHVQGAGESGERLAVFSPIGRGQ